MAKPLWSRERCNADLLDQPAKVSMKMIFETDMAVGTDTDGRAFARSEC
jgi:hypothetical protein